MEVDIHYQLHNLLLSLSLGLGGGIFYDLLRAVRMRRKKSAAVTHLLDAAFVLLAAWMLLYLCVAKGGGELRLYMLAGVMAGALLWFLLPGPYCRELWDFWLDVAAEALRLLWKPVAWGIRWGKKIIAAGKKSFSFPGKYATIKRLSPISVTVYRRRKGGRPHGQTKEKSPAPESAGVSGGSNADRDRRR